MVLRDRQPEGARRGSPEPTADRRLSLSSSSETPPPPHQKASSPSPTMAWTSWTGARGPPPYSPSTAFPRQHSNSTKALPIVHSLPPPWLAQIESAPPPYNPRDRVLQTLSELTVCSEHISQFICRH